MHRSGRHFLQIPGPTNTPDRVLRAMAQPTIDHRSAEFAALGRAVLDGLKPIFQTSGAVVIFPASGTGAWEASLVNTLSPGDRVLAFDIGEFSRGWAEVARRLGLDVEIVPGDWRHGVDPAALEARLGEDRDHRIRAVLVVHNETSTGVTSRLPEIRRALDRAGHPALLLVDAVSSLGSIDLRHDEWGLDVTLAGSQKGLMLPPGISFNAISEKALAASRSAGLPRSYFAWEPMLRANETGFFPYTPATNLLFGLREALAMLDEEGLPNVFARHLRLAAAARAAVTAWGLEIACAREDEYSPVLTTVMMPESHDADRFRAVVLERFNMSLGAGLGRFKGRAFRIGHLGDFNDLMLAGTLCGVEMGLALAGVPFSAAESMRRWLRSANLSASSERRRPLVEKRGDPFAKILAAITRRREVVGGGLVETATEGDAADDFLGSADGQRRVVGDGVSEVAHRVVDRVRLGHARHESERCGFRRVEEPSGEEQLLRACRTDQIDEARAVGGRQAIAQRAGDRDAEPGRGRAHAEIAGQRDQAAAAGGHALHLRDGWHRHPFESIDDLLHAALIGQAIVGGRE